MNNEGDSAAIFMKEVGAKEETGEEGGVYENRSAGSLKLRQLYNKLLCVSSFCEERGQGRLSSDGTPAEETTCLLGCSSSVLSSSWVEDLLPLGVCFWWK